MNPKDCGQNELPIKSTNQIIGILESSNTKNKQPKVVNHTGKLRLMGFEKNY